MALVKENQSCVHVSSIIRYKNIRSKHRMHLSLNNKKTAHLSYGVLQSIQRCCDGKYVIAAS